MLPRAMAEPPWRVAQDNHGAYARTPALPHAW